MMASDRDLFGGGACIAQHMMGPDAVAILQELLQAQPLRPGWPGQPIRRGRPADDPGGPGQVHEPGFHHRKEQPPGLRAGQGA